MDIGSWKNFPGDEVMGKIFAQTEKDPKEAEQEGGKEMQA